MRREGRLAIGAVLLLLSALGATWWASPRPEPIAQESARKAPPQRRQPAARPRSQAGWRDVRCEVPLSREGDEVVAMAVGNREATQIALIEDGGFALVLPPGALTMLFDVPGLETVHATIDEGGRCTISPPPRRQLALTLSVTLPSGKVPVGATIRGCGSAWTWIPSDPVWRVMVSEPCELVAWSNDGGMAQVSEPVLVDPAKGDQDIALALPWESPAGLRLQAVKRSDTFEVTEVGGQAAELVAVGEHIVAIEGEPAAELSLADFVRLDAGPPDTSVTLRVRDDEGLEREVEVPRER